MKFLLVLSILGIFCLPPGTGATNGTELSSNNNSLLPEFDVREFVRQLLVVSDTVFATGQKLAFQWDVLENWEGLEEISHGFPYYVAGYDDENRPIWVIEFGKWDLRSVMEQGPEMIALFDMHVYAGIYRLYQTLLHSTSPDGLAVTGFNIIIDFDGLKLTQIMHIQTVAHLIGLFQVFNELLVRHLHLALLVNMNFIAERLLNMVRPVLGSAAEKLEVFGTNRDKWLPVLLRHFPRDQLPEWYGGFKHFQPLAVYG